MSCPGTTHNMKLNIKLVFCDTIKSAVGINGCLFGSIVSSLGGIKAIDTFNTAANRLLRVQSTQEPATARPRKTYCNGSYDGYLCWSPTEAGEVASQKCPPGWLSDTNKFAYRRCGNDGMWLGRNPNETSQLGWTNYTPCFPPLVQTLLNRVYDESEEQAHIKFQIAQTTRYMEIAGFAISLLALTLSLAIFSHYRSLRNHRTRIHKCLFSTMIFQMLIRLIIYIDQALVRRNDRIMLESNSTILGIDNTNYVCESCYVLLEYSITCMFMWMFLEGLYLHSMVTGNSLRDKIYFIAFYITGWGVPVIFTAIWATFTALHYQAEEFTRCWYGYNFLWLYWIMQGPRLAVVLVNLIFLLNILRALIGKLRQSTSTEMQKLRKAVRAALVLLPLLGITNALNMTEAPLDGNVWKFGFWSYSTHLLRSLQGFFIALIYCFLNSEVRQVISKHYENYQAVRMYRRRPPYADEGIEMKPIKRRRGKPPKEPKLRIRFTRRPATITTNISDTSDFGTATTSQVNRKIAVRFSETPTVSATVHTGPEDIITEQDPRPSTSKCRTYHGTPRHHAVIVHEASTPNRPRPKLPLGELYD